MFIKLKIKNRIVEQYLVSLTLRLKIMDRSNLQCDVCLKHFNDIKKLAMHRVKHLVISISLIPPCPFCQKPVEMPVLTDFCRHVMNHFIEDELEQAKFIKWLSNQNRFDNYCRKHKSLEDQWSAVMYRDVKIRLPVITFDLKCLYCGKLTGGQDKKSMGHILDHFPVISSKKKPHLVLWFSKFFETEESIQIIQTFCDYLDERKKLDSNSLLLEKLSMFENESTNKCRLCKWQLPDAASLYSHYMTLHGNPSAVYWNCAICNFKEASSAEFVNHVYRKHLGCICGEKFRSFDACLQHSKSCLRACPHCKNKLTFKSMIKHLNRGRSDLMCPYCGVKEKEREMLKNHVCNCSSRITAVYCPTCKNFRSTDDGKLRNHLLECKPWLDVFVEMPCQPNYHEKSNLINVYDIRDYLNESIVSMIEDNFL